MVKLNNNLLAPLTVSHAQEIYNFEFHNICGLQTKSISMFLRHTGARLALGYPV